MRRCDRFVVLALAVLAGCVADTGDGLADFDEADDGVTPTSSGAELDTMGDSTATEGASTSAADEAPMEQRFDLATPDAPGDVEPCGLVDLLFVIDNSGSMGDEQANLVASFPGFIGGIESILPTTDYHVGVITTDDNDFNGIGCQHLGALTVATGGEMSSDKACGPYTAGRRYMSADDDLDHDFSCAAQVGIDGSGAERPMDAIGVALDPISGDLGSCNTGFLRDDALLVLVLITDEEDDGDSVGDPTDWFAAIVDAKHGHEENVVVLALVGHEKPNNCIPEQWTGMEGAEIAPRLIEFAESFGFGRVGDVCADSYDEFFTDAIVGIADACNVVVPVG